MRSADVVEPALDDLSAREHDGLAASNPVQFARRKVARVATEVDDHDLSGRYAALGAIYVDGESHAAEIHEIARYPLSRIQEQRCALLSYG